MRLIIIVIIKTRELIVIAQESIPNRIGTCTPLTSRFHRSPKLKTDRRAEDEEESVSDEEEGGFGEEKEEDGEEDESE